MEGCKCSGKTREEILTVVEQLYNSSAEKCQGVYDKIAEDYDEFMKALDYHGPKRFCAEFSKMKISKEAKLLDLGAGTGQVGALLQKAGYTNIDCLDANEKMLEVAMKKGIYKSSIVTFLSKGSTIPVEKDTYDVVIAVAAIYPGHIEHHVFPELIRITKPGGIITWLTINLEEFRDHLPNYIELTDEMNAEVQRLCELGAWKLFQKPCLLSEIYAGAKGILRVMQKS